MTIDTQTAADGGDVGGGDAIGALTAEAVNFLSSGDKAKADAAFARRDAIARAAAGEKPVRGAQATPAAPAENEAAVTDEPSADAAPPADDAAAPNYNFDDMTDVAKMLTAQGEAGVALAREWGDPGGQDFKENVNHAVETVRALNRENPGLSDVMRVPLTMPDGRELVLGNDPWVVKIMSELGRLRAAASAPGKERNAGPSSARSPVPAPARGPNDIEADITKMLKDAPIGSRAYVEPAFQKRLQALYSERYTRPIVGTRSRTI